ncbi:DNA polymerase alpha/epsilon subunit B-domain-containing protein [Ochromonadaceae sp. CCMP2298]|nr:DNA polymerase alpha/epsilon subunit B-domain-containing protein [Ochromonadaceae sp. CCMP2298]|mmetsp:Transcript_29945/g.66241  ORF Transcript_29945/g.66241 Transcript_29945/m.66241 type:complete len:704 (+) Transcript_29945:133-2244(+)
MSVPELNEMRVQIEKNSMESLISEPDVLQKCVVLWSRYKQPLSDFLVHLEAFVLNSDSESLTPELMGSFEQVLHKESQKEQKEAQAAGKGVVAGKDKEDLHHTSPDATTLGKRSPDFKTPNLDKASKMPARAAPGATASKAGSLGVSFGKQSQSQSQGQSQSQSQGQSQGSQGMSQLEAGLSQGSAVAYATRPNQGQPMATLNPGLGTRGEFDPSDRKPIGMRCQVSTDQQIFHNVSDRYRYMFTTLDERGAALDRHHLSMQEQMCAKAALAEEDLHAVGVPSQDLVWVCGRICCEAAVGRINKTSVLLEGSRRDSGGRRVHLDLQEVPAFSLFPGQIVLVQGINSSGRKMVAKHIVEGIPPPPCTTSPAKLLEYHHSKLHQGGAPLSVVTAAGPFTTSDNLDYQPLQDLLVNVLKTKPDVLILVGPFVDITQPLLKDGAVQLTNEDEQGVVETHGASYEMVFVEKVIRDCLKSLFESEMDFGGVLPTQIVMVPSLLDAHHEFVFPQPPFGDRERVRTAYFQEDLGVLDVPFSKVGDLKRRVHLMSNPCMFRVNEVLFGVCSNDTLFSMSSDEVSQNIDGNRLQRLYSHLLQQQSFCPQFPAPQSGAAQCDLRQSRHWEFGTKPDVMVLPSRLAALAKDVMGTLVVNPGSLARGVGGGTYAQMDIHPMKETDLRSAVLAQSQGNGDAMAHGVSSRTAVTISKI